MQLDKFIHQSNVLVHEWNQVNDLFRQIISAIASLKIDVALHGNYIDGQIQFFLKKYEILIKNIDSTFPESLRLTAEQTKFKQLFLDEVKGKKERTTVYIQRWYNLRLAELAGIPITNMTEVHTLMQAMKIEMDPIGEVAYINPTSQDDNVVKDWSEEQLWQGCFTGEISSVPQTVGPVVENHHFTPSNCDNGGEYQNETGNMPYDVPEGVIDLSPHYQAYTTKAMPFQFFNAEKPSQDHEGESSLKFSM